MRILAFLTDPAVVRPILRHLRIPEHPPPISPARGPPQTEVLAVDPPSPWDGASHGSPGSPRRDPFDQSLPGGAGPGAPETAGGGLPADDRSLHAAR